MFKVLFSIQKRKAMKFFRAKKHVKRQEKANVKKELLLIIFSFISKIYDVV